MGHDEGVFRNISHPSLEQLSCQSAQICFELISHGFLAFLSLCSIWFGMAVVSIIWKMSQYCLNLIDSTDNFLDNDKIDVAKMVIQFGVDWHVRLCLGCAGAAAESYCQ